MNERKACACCGRTVARFKFEFGYHGKRMARHKCPHGVWCTSGDRLLGQHANHNTRCRECMNRPVGRFV